MLPALRSPTKASDLCNYTGYFGLKGFTPVIDRTLETNHSITQVIQSVLKIETLTKHLEIISSCPFWNWFFEGCVSCRIEVRFVLVIGLANDCAWKWNIMEFVTLFLYSSLSISLDTNGMNIFICWLVLYKPNPFKCRRYDIVQGLELRKFIGSSNHRIFCVSMKSLLSTMGGFFFQIYILPLKSHLITFQLLPHCLYSRGFFPAIWTLNVSCVS